MKFEGSLPDTLTITIRFLCNTPILLILALTVKANLFYPDVTAPLARHLRMLIAQPNGGGEEYAHSYESTPYPHG